MVQHSKAFLQATMRKLVVSLGVAHGLEAWFAPKIFGSQKRKRKKEKKLGNVEETIVS